LLAAPVFLSFATNQYKRTPVYSFDKSLGQLVIHYRNRACQNYALTDVFDVIAVSTANDDPPPSYWRKVRLIMRSGVELELHPGHEQPNKQEEMVTVIRHFLDL
jgi:hypothetical protein